MNANELADELKRLQGIHPLSIPFVLDEAATMLRQQQILIENLNGRIERMIENASHHEGIAHAGGFETGYQAGLKKAQEK